MNKLSFKVILLGLGLGLLSVGCSHHNGGELEIRVLKENLHSAVPSRDAGRDEAVAPKEPSSDVAGSDIRAYAGTPPAADVPSTDVPPSPTPPTESASDSPPAALPAANLECTQDSDCADGKTCDFVDGVKRCTTPLVAVAPLLAFAPLPPAPPTTGTIHAFARCVNKQNQSYLCHYSGPSESARWVDWVHGGFHQDSIYQMSLDYQPAVVYQAAERKIHVFAYSRAGSGDWGGAGSLSWLSCDAGNDNGNIPCGPAQRVTSLNRVKYVPSVVALDGGGLFAFFNGGDGLYFVMRDQQDKFSTEVRISSVLEDGHEADVCRGVDFSPSAVVRKVEGGEEIHAFAATADHRLLHAYLTAEGVRQVLQDPRKAVWHCEAWSDVGLNSSPKALVDPGNNTEINIAALDTSNRPQVWLASDLGGGRLKPMSQGPIADVAVNMPPAEYLGVVALPNSGDASTFHIFYRLNDGTLGHVATRRGAPNPGDPEAHGWSGGLHLIDSPTAVSDTAGNLHVFGGLPSDASYSFVGQCGKSASGEWQCGSQTYYRDFGVCHYADPDGFHRWDRDCDLREHGDFVEGANDGRSGLSAVYVPIAYNPGN